MSKLDTGPNPHKGRQLLKQAAERLVLNGAKILQPIADQGGIYAYEMVLGGQVFTLVARGPPWARPPDRQLVVSSQLAALVVAQTSEIPLVMACILRRDPHGPVIDWRLFIPEEVRHKMLGMNERAGVQMVNWHWKIGSKFVATKEIPLKARQARKLWELEKQEKLVATKLGRYA